MSPRLHSSGLMVLATGLLMLTLTACGQSEAPGCGGLDVSQPWVRAAPAGADVMGAYFTLANDGDTRVTVNGVASSQFERAEMHQTVVNDDGQASMQPLDEVAIAAGEKVEFKSGGRHVMLFSPSQAYKAGDQVEVILACGSQQAELPVAAVVRAGAPGASSRQSSSGESATQEGQADAAGDTAESE